MVIDFEDNSITYFAEDGQLKKHVTFSTHFSKIEVLIDGRLLVMEDHYQFKFENNPICIALIGCWRSIGFFRFPILLMILTIYTWDFLHMGKGYLRIVGRASESKLILKTAISKTLNLLNEGFQSEN